MNDSILGRTLNAILAVSALVAIAALGSKVLVGKLEVDSIRGNALHTMSYDQAMLAGVTHSDAVY